MPKRPSDPRHPPPATESGEGGAFLSRWARRKRVARAGLDPDAPASGSSGDHALHAKAAPEIREQPLQESDADSPELGDEDMPPVEAIDENTDMSGFFSAKVSEAVKKAALKKFFHSPVFNIVDGLDDYDEDFRSFEALGDIVTSDMRGVMERKSEQAEEALAKDAAVAEGPTESEPAPADAATDAAADASRDGHAAGPGTDETEGESATHASADAGNGERGVTRDPASPTGMASAKLRPRSSDADA